MNKTKFGIIVFPGSNCDHDAYHVVKQIAKREVNFLWHKEHDLQESDVIIVPGGFSYGDYLRSGAIARYSPIMTEVVRFAERGGLVMGVCNGFQILTEAGLLPGALLRNASRQFVCDNVTLRVENASTSFTSSLKEGALMNIDIAHGEGNYFTDADTLKQIEDNNQVLFRYCDKSGNISPESNPNGSMNNIAGIINPQGNVLGMMPHPERCSESILGSADGFGIFESIIMTLEREQRFATVS
jgi:phosphoribosylformylglycinamidine synthase subunit PurQ / glutaminase